MSKSHQIQYLITRRYPFYGYPMWEYFETNFRELGWPDTTAINDEELQTLWDEFPNEIEELIGDSEQAASPIEAIRKFVIGMTAYLKQLMELPNSEFVKLYRKAKHAQRAQQIERGAEADQWRFFNEPEADAKFDWWARCAQWSTEEAIALSFGKEPKIVNTDSLKKKLERRYSPFVKEYEQRKQLVLRAIAAGNLKEPMSPSSFLEWATNIDIQCPEELLAAVKFPDRKSLVEQLTQEVGLLKRELERLNEELTRYNEELTRYKDQPLHAKERKSLMAMTLAMATEKYGYRPGQNNNAATRISSAVEKIGLTLDNDTVRGWLSKANEELEPKWSTSEN